MLVAFPDLAERPNHGSFSLTAPTAEPGICGGCGLGTAYVCTRCRKAHFCDGCLELAQGTHRIDCGQIWCEAVCLPPAVYRECWLNALLRSGWSFSLPRLSGEHPLKTLVAHPSYGVAQLQFDADASAALADVILKSREQGVLTIAGRRFLGFRYGAITEPVNEAEQRRVTSRATKTKGGIDWCMEHCAPLRRLVQEACDALGLAGRWQKWDLQPW